MAGDGRDRDQKSATDDSGSTDDSGKPIDVRRWRPGRRTVLVAGVVGLAGVGAGTVYMSDDDPDRRTAEPGDAANLNELLDDAEAVTRSSPRRASTSDRSGSRPTNSRSGVVAREP